MDFVRLLVVSLLAMGMCKSHVAYGPSMYMPYFPMEGPSKPYKLPGELSHAPVFPRSLYFPRQQEPGTGKPHVSKPMLPPFQSPQFPGKAPCSLWNPTGPCRPQTFPVEPKYPIGDPVPQVSLPMLPAEPKYPLLPSVELPQFPGKPPCSLWNPTGPCRPQTFPVEPKYPIGGPVHQVPPPKLPVGPKNPIGPVPQVQQPMLPPFQPPQFPGKAPCSMWNPTGLCRLQTFPVEPKYPVGGPVPQVPPQNPGPKNPIGGPVPQVQQPMLPPFQLPQFPGNAPCSMWSPAGPCRRQTFPVEPKYPIGGPVNQVPPPKLPVGPQDPIGGPVGYGLMPFLMFNLEGGKAPEDPSHHGQLAMSPNCQTKWPFLPCN